MYFRGLPIKTTGMAFASMWTGSPIVVQTLGGDHGGGSPDEVDSALLAVDVGRLRALRTAEGTGVRQQAATALQAPVMPQVHCWRSPSAGSHCKAKTSLMLVQFVRSMLAQNKDIWT